MNTKMLQLQSCKDAPICSVLTTNHMNELLPHWKVTKRASYIIMLFFFFFFILSHGHEKVSRHRMSSSHMDFDVTNCLAMLDAVVMGDPPGVHLAHLYPHSATQQVDVLLALTPISVAQLFVFVFSAPRQAAHKVWSPSQWSPFTHTQAQ